MAKAKRNPLDQTEHDTLVLMMAFHLRSLGYTNIKADIAPFPNPETVCWNDEREPGRVPDLICRKNDTARTLIVLEAETCPSLNTTHTRSQWKLFAAYAHERDGEFHVVTPRLCVPKKRAVRGADLAFRLAENIDITVDYAWWPLPQKR